MAIAKVNHIQKAQRQVEKAVTVFDKAIKEVDKAQETLLQGIENDSYEINALRTKLVKTKARIAEVEQDKLEKGEAIKRNKEILKNLKEFQA